MHHRRKLREASYFLQRMLAESDTPEHFQFELSAFLGASRSVLQYILEDARKVPGGQSWYDQAVASDPVILFLKNKRDENVHSRPVESRKVWRLEIRTHLDLGDDMIIPYEHHSTSTVYYFDDWSSNETVAEVGARYLQVLSSILEGGSEKGFIRASAA